MPGTPPQNEERAIIHVDMDAFYASVEVMDDPALAGLPVIVGGTPEGRGVVSAASYEARRFGVHSAMSAYRAKKLCPDGVFVRPRMSRYVEISKRIRRIFEDFTPLVEPISLDEAFLDVSGSRRLFGTPVEIGRAIKRRIGEEVGLVASVGVAPNKYLAKLASDLEKPDGFVVITRENAERILSGLPVRRLWGVGKQTQKLLARKGIHTIGDVTATPLEELEARLGVLARRLKNLAMGVDDRPVVADWEAKSISNERTFAHDIGDAGELREIADTLSEMVARRLRKSGLLAQTVQIKARFPDFTTLTRAMTLPQPTESTQSIRDAVRDLLEQKLHREGRPLRLLGVGVSNFVHPGEETEDLFSGGDRRKSADVDHLIDDLQDRFGADVIHRGRGRRKRGGED
ncbi:MAG: DNA polymerase IV [Candidatus Latescibacterota bacterium]|jgi:DNA polymerase-4